MGFDRPIGAADAQGIFTSANWTVMNRTNGWDAEILSYRATLERNGSLILVEKGASVGTDEAARDEMNTTIEPLADQFRSAGFGVAVSYHGGGLHCGEL